MSDQSNGGTEPLLPNPVSEPLRAETLCGAFQTVVSLRPSSVAVQTPDREFCLTWSELDAEVRGLASTFAHRGLVRGDTVALLLPNRPEHHVVDYALMHLGVTTFGIYTTSSREQIVHQLQKAGARMIITDQTAIEQVVAAIGPMDAPPLVVLLEDPVGGTSMPDGFVTLSELRSQAAAGDGSAFDFDSTWRAVEPDDILMLVFTSGTTGSPKCAEYTHAGAIAQLRSLNDAVPINREDVVSFLPLAHLGGRMTVHYLALAHGATITTCANMLELTSVLPLVHPDSMQAVPRLFEKFQSAIEERIDALPPAERDLARTGVSSGMLIAAAVERDEMFADEVRDRMTAEHTAAVEIIRPFLVELGLDRLNSAYTGGAPVAPELTHFFRAIGVPLLESFGSTETGLIIFNRVDSFKAMTAGQALPGVEIRVLPDGEMLCRATFMMKGYRAEPEATRDVMDEEGWLHTGDVAVIDDEGFIAFVDRKKDILINSSGKSMSPVAIESAIKGETLLVGGMIVVGDRRKYVTALMTLSADAVADLSRRWGLDPADLETMTTDERVVAEIQAAVDRGNARLSRPEQVKSFTLLPTVWAAGGDELTPTMKTRRRVIEHKYAADIDSMYEAQSQRWPSMSEHGATT